MTPFISTIRLMIATAGCLVLASPAGTSPVASSPVGASGAGVAVSVPGCPRTCFCNTLSRIVYCSRRGLDSVPVTLPAATLQLNLNGNRFRSTALLKTNFSSATFHAAAIEHLYLSDCGIETVQVGAFVALVNLRWLDLSDNHLVVVPGQCFEGLNLQHLFLNGNRGVKLDPSAFVHLSVSGLYLHDCLLDDLPVTTISPLNASLVNLWLNGNRFSSLDKRHAELFSGLTHLRLGSNPLRCNCDILWLKELYDKKGGATFRGAEQPTCTAPTPVRARHFGQLSLADFRCRAPSFGNVDASFVPADMMQSNGLSRGHLRCTATGEPIPTLYWIRPSGRTIRYDAKIVSDDMHVKDASTQGVTRGPRHRHQRSNAMNDEGRNEAVLELASGNEEQVEAGLYICIAANDVGNVTLTVNLTWPASSGTDHLVTWRPTNSANKPLRPVLLPTQNPSASSAELAVINLDEIVDRGRAEIDFESDFDLTNEGGYGYKRADVTVQGRGFSASEMAIAVVATHVLTLLLLLFFGAATIPGCRRRLTSLMPSRQHRGHQRGTDQPVVVTGTRDLGRSLCSGAGTSANSPYDVGESLLKSLSTPSRGGVNDSSCQFTRDFASNYCARKYFWPASATGTLDFESC